MKAAHAQFPAASSPWPPCISVPPCEIPGRQTHKRPRAARVAVAQRTLYLDVRQGVTAADVLAALVDLGVAPSPILHAVAAMELPAELRIEQQARGVRVRVEPDEAPMPVPVGGVRMLVDGIDEFPRPAAHVAQEAMAKLVIAEARNVQPLRRDLFAAHVDAGALACIAGAALAIHALAPAQVLASRVGAPESLELPLVELLGDWADHLDFGQGDATTYDGAALLRALLPDDAVGRDEPAWRGSVARGSGERVRAAMAHLSP